MRVTVLLLLSALALAAGCDPSSNQQNLEGDDAGMDAPVVVPERDASSRDAGPAPCERDLDCGPGQLCLGGLCQADPCATDNPCAAPNDRCRAACVPTSDPCEGVVCGPEETCVGGECFPGCLPVACEGVSCRAGHYCDPARGTCVPIQPCDAACGEGSTCHVSCSPRSACEGVTCADGEFCRAGACIPNPCAGVTCAPGEVCHDGLCTGTCGCDPACVAPDRCVAGMCTCVRRCPADAVCGAPDGCGGFCTGPCPTPGEECNPDTGTCECVPHCPADGACGAPDGCGGHCDGSCPSGRTCVSGSCECGDECLAPAEVACGVDIPATCSTGSPCSGRGTLCEAGSECLEDACCPRCDSSRTIPCGVLIPPAMDSMGRACRTCDGVGTLCERGTVCVSPPDSTAPTDRVCCAPCAPASSVACGTRIPDVLDADGEVCRTCGGYGTAGCGAGTTCTGGAEGVCCAPCDAATAVSCGEPIPSPDCRACTGFGTHCDPGLTCANPPGTSGPDARTCCGPCPLASSVACGEPIADPVGADGLPCRNCGTGTMCPAGASCVDGSCCPQCPSPSTVACGVDIPDQRDASGAVCRVCGVGSVCGAGSTCAGGVCCGACEAASTLACGVDPVEAPGCPACPNGTRCAAGERCGAGGCCAPTCTPPSSRPCGDQPADGCGGLCAPGTGCATAAEVCTGSPARCECRPSCEGRRCGESDGCGGECPGTCDPGFLCAERPPPAPRGDYQCEVSSCVPSCGLCQACVAGSCEPLTCAPGESVCLLACQCCAAGEACTPSGCQTVS
ncbi:MAG: hypothetical protein U0353_18760 [Sandaracinus sp.]